MKHDLKDVIKSVTRVGITAIEAAITRALASKQFEVTIAHYFRALLDDPASDVSVLVGVRGANVEAVKRLFDARIDQLRTGNAGRPTFSPTFMALLAAAGLDFAGGPRTARSGNALALALDRPDKFDFAREREALFALGVSITVAEVQAGEVSRSAEQTNKTTIRPRLERVRIEHVAQVGETLAAIAARYVLDLETVARDNDLDVLGPLTPGRKIVLSAIKGLTPAGRPSGNDADSIPTIEALRGKLERAGGRPMNDDERAALHAAGLRVPARLLGALRDLALVGAVLHVPEAEDASGMGADLQVLDARQIASEALDHVPGLAALGHGLFPFGMCLNGSGDPYFWRASDGAIVRVPHTAVTMTELGGELRLSGVELVALSLPILVLRSVQLPEE